MRATMLAVVVLGLGACEMEEPADGSDTGGPEGCLADDLGLSLGTGVLEYSPVSENDDITIVHGPQGGWHIDVAGRLSNTGQEVSIAPTVTLLETGDQLAGDQNPSLQAIVDYDADACTGDFFGLRAFIDDFSPQDDLPYQAFVCSLGGKQLALSVRVTDFATNRTVVEEVTLVAAHDAVDQENCP